MVIHICILLCVGGVLRQALLANSEIVELSYGKLLGQDNGFYHSYQSIPYAEPPLGPLRFEAPEPYKLKWSGIFNATEPPLPCMQWNQFKRNANGQSKLDGVEDCLKLNVYVPKSLTKRTYPVVVKIHGGAFMFGGIAAYRPDRIMKAGNCILVAISYRLGPLGFLSAEHKDLTGNFGLKDQRLALVWIKKNIVHFGGDPDNIMLVGHSAGGASVHFQLMRRDFSKLANAAASISGVALNPWAMPKMSRERAFAIGDILGCDHKKNALRLKRCLQLKPAEDIVATVEQFQVFGYVPFTMFGPVVEDPKAPQAFMTTHPRKAMKAGEYSQVPWLVTYTKEDGAYNAASLLKRSNKTQRELIEVLNTRWLDLAPHYLFYQQQGPSTYARSMQLRRQYMDTDSFNLLSYSKVEKMFTDILFKNGIEEVIRLHRFKGRSPLYAYLYDNPAVIGAGQALAHRNDIRFGTAHGDDYFLMFPTNLMSVMRPDEEIISEKFYNMLVSLASHVKNDLQFGSCRFIDNLNQSRLHLMHITRDDCASLTVDHLP